MAKRKKNHKPIQFRNSFAHEAGRRQRNGGGIHKDRRLKRKNRQSWRKELDL